MHIKRTWAVKLTMQVPMQQWLLHDPDRAELQLSWCQGTQPVGHKAPNYLVYISRLSPALQSLYLSLFTRSSPSIFQQWYRVDSRVTVHAKYSRPAWRQVTLLNSLSAPATNIIRWMISLRSYRSHRKVAEDTDSFTKVPTETEPEGLPEGQDRPTSRWESNKMRQPPKPFCEWYLLSWELSKSQ